MTTLDTRPAAPATYGRRRTDRPSLPDWLDAPLLASEDPRDGNLVDPESIGAGDYVLEFHASTGTASWLRVHAVAVVGAHALVTCGRGVGVTLSFPVGREVWVLRRADAALLMQAACDRVLGPWGSPEKEMEALLRSFASRAELLAGWRDPASLADALTAWSMLRTSDLANRTDARRVASTAAAL